MVHMDDRKIEKLILLVREYEEIYDTNNRNYSNKLKKDNIWVDIGKQLGEDAETCKNKWKCLRDAYRRASKNGTKNGQTASRICKWRFGKFMSFLVPYSKAGQHPTLKKECEDSEASELDFDDTTEHELKERCTNERLKVTEYVDVADSLVNSSLPQSASFPQDHIKAKRRSRKRPSSEPMPQIFEEYIEEKPRIQEFETREPEADDLIEFFINMAKTVKTFTPYLQAKVKKQVFQIVNTTELQVLQKQI